MLLLILQIISTSYTLAKCLSNIYYYEFHYLLLQTIVTYLYAKNICGTLRYILMYTTQCPKSTAS